MNLPAREAAMATNLSDTTLNFHAFMEFLVQTWQGHFLLGVIALGFLSIFVVAKYEQKQ